MNKDVIYIDVDEDITSVIGKVKAANEKIVVLVPPKRIGILQSAVNLRLLHRAAEQAKKRLVLISNDSALHALAASASIPVAKNLQSKPEVPEVPALAVDGDDDIIDGSQLPVGEHAKQSGQVNVPVHDGTTNSPTIGAAVLDSLPDESESTLPAKATTPPKKKGAKVPNFNTFRKKLIIGGVLLTALMAFMIWAFVFAPSATVIVSAKTSDESVNLALTAAEDQSTSADKQTIAAVKTQSSDDASLDFDATGTKNVGKKSSGTVEFTNNTLSDRTVSGGTRLTSESGLVFITDETITVPAGSLPCGNLSCPTPGSESVGVTAEERGAKYNAEDGSVSGEPSGVSGEFTGPTSGGTDKKVKIVTAGDVQTARQKLVDQKDESIKQQLAGAFEDTVKPLNESFSVTYKDVSSDPAIGEEAGGTATISATVVYSMHGIETGELNSFLNNYVASELDDTANQRVYQSGADSAEFQDVQTKDDGVSLTLVATSKIGPKLDEDKIKQESRGRRFSEIQNSIQQIQGVQDVDVKFFPFWRSTVPDDPEKITVTFRVDG